MDFTEKHIREQIRKILFENHDKEKEENYNKILDLYNKVGLEGMEDDEIAYLKSGGKTDLPKNLKAQDSQEEYDKFMQSKGQGFNAPIKPEDYSKILQLKKILDSTPFEVTYPYEGAGFFLDLLFVIEFRKDNALYEKLSKIFPDVKGVNSPIWVGDDKIKIDLPKDWEGELL